MIIWSWPAERTEDVKQKAETMPEPAAETISEQNVEIAKPKLTPPNLLGNIAKPSLYVNGTKYHNRTVKVKPCFQNVSVSETWENKRIRLAIQSSE